MVRDSWLRSDNITGRPLMLIGTVVGVLDFLLLSLTSFNSCDFSDELDIDDQIECYCDASAVTLYNISGHYAMRCKWTTSTCILCWLSNLSSMLLFVLEISSISSSSTGKPRKLKMEWAILSIFGFITSGIMIKNIVDDDCDQYKVFNIRCEILLFAVSIFFHVLFCSLAAYFYIKNKTQTRTHHHR